MTVQTNYKTTRRFHPLKSLYRLQGLLDIAAITAWGVLLLQYWLTGKINLLLHPNYVWLAYSAGFVLLGVATVKIAQFIWRVAQLKKRKDRNQGDLLQHLSLFPPGWSSALLLAVALFGLQFTPQPFASQMALDRGVTETLTMTRSQPQAFRTSTKPENRTLIDWIRTLNVYPEPDAYTGQKVNVEGFVLHLPQVPDNYIGIARFVITCCAADAYPVGMPVKLPSGNRSAYQPDKWYRVEGQMITETLADKRQLVIQASQLTEIPTPANPYAS
ncbi:MAG: TIGR03943 family putative permease subunit [Leptolyngbya sp. IPPAS B-1204]|nr:TIGR03943 family protein [Elainella sp. C42_A2020_010]RNJ70422.1 MAG: TIGR03943 family protein [Leptolyngbya sp. IPPAS B-1204]